MYDNFENINIKIAEFIRIKRQKNNLSIIKLSKMSALSRQTIYTIENGINNSYKDINICNKNYHKILVSLNSNFKELYNYVYKK